VSPAGSAANGSPSCARSHPARLSLWLLPGCAQLMPETTSASSSESCCGLACVHAYLCRCSQEVYYGYQHVAHRLYTYSSFSATIDTRRYCTVERHASAHGVCAPFGHTMQKQQRKHASFRRAGKLRLCPGLAPAVPQRQRPRAGVGGLGVAQRSVCADVAAVCRQCCQRAVAAAAAAAATACCAAVARRCRRCWRRAYQVFSRRRDCHQTQVGGR